MTSDDTKAQTTHGDQIPIYRLIACERVRIAVRDPVKRYGQVINCETDETYLQEFTDEEEREADAQQAKWEAEAPAREAAVREAERQAEEFRSTLVYQRRIVAFLDVLGWAHAVALSETDADLAKRLGVALASVREQIQNSDKIREDFPAAIFDIRISQFSDSIVVSMAAGDLDRDQDQFSWALRQIVYNFLSAGLLVRGGVTVGPMIHQGNLAYGPALTEAYGMEQRAINPRIILSSELSEIWGLGTPIFDRNGNIIDLWSEWRIDRVDGVIFLDFLGPWPRGVLSEHFVFRFNQAAGIVDKWLRESRSYRVRDKYVWLAKYLSVLNAEFPQEGLVWPSEGG